MAAQTAKLEKLTLTACSLVEGKLSVNGDVYEALLNPESFKHNYTITYHDSGEGCRQTVPLGSLGYEPKFAGYEPEDVSFELVLDGTGVVKDSSKKTVAQRIKQLKGVAYRYEGKAHEPNVVQLSWGDFIFNGRLTTLQVDYTLFKPSGEPLRAKVSLAFRGFMSAKEEALRKNNSSPDLTHYVIVRAGDTLPLLCYQIYRDCRYYREVATSNELDSFRNLRPGSRLYFPPLS